uniref:Uncharacterized protein n=1 Tax=Oryza glumipatula TaxID=40148 RepID=A0A0E0A3H8_9ORYZ
MGKEKRNEGARAMPSSLLSRRRARRAIRTGTEHRSHGAAGCLPAKGAATAPPTTASKATYCTRRGLKFRGLYMPNVQVADVSNLTAGITVYKKDKVNCMLDAFVFNNLGLSGFIPLRLQKLSKNLKRDIDIIIPH